MREPLLLPGVAFWICTVKGRWGLAANPLQGGPPSRQLVRGAQGRCPEARENLGPRWAPGKSR